MHGKQPNDPRPWRERVSVRENYLEAGPVASRPDVIASRAKQSRSGLPRRGLLAMTGMALRRAPARRHPLFRATTASLIWTSENESDPNYRPCLSSQGGS